MVVYEYLLIKTEIITLYRFARNAENGMMTQVSINNLRNPALTSKGNPHWVGPDAAKLVLRHAVVIPSVLDLAGPLEGEPAVGQAVAGVQLCADLHLALVCHLVPEELKERRLQDVNAHHHPSHYYCCCCCCCYYYYYYYYYISKAQIFNMPLVLYI